MTEQSKVIATELEDIAHAMNTAQRLGNPGNAEGCQYIQIGHELALAWAKRLNEIAGMIYLSPIVKVDNET